MSKLQVERKQLSKNGCDLLSRCACFFVALFSLFFPELTQILQPLSGEYAGFRELFDKVPFPIGYGIETSLILDICEQWGLDVIAQVDLERRVHRNQDTKALGRMAFVIIKTFLDRVQKLNRIDVKQDIFDEMIQYQLIRDTFQPEMHVLEQYERPPIIQIPEYQEKFSSIAPS